ncbi:MAG: hypothetical protein WCX61_02765 [Candidatus Peribacteraceae bacterium]|jgi:hypothetical protein
MTNENLQRPTAGVDTPKIPIVSYDCSLGVPLDDPRFWPDGKAPGTQARHLLGAGEGEGEG